MKTHNISQTFEDYLEQIYVFELIGTENIQSQQLANKFEVSRAAVSKILSRLVEEGFIEKESYGSIYLTNKGRNVAKEVLDRHQTIRQFLYNIGVSATNAAIDCCKMEHVICEETLEKFKEFNKNYPTIDFTKQKVEK